jgi:macrolide transport system ATP-binding/permease protein
MTTALRCALAWLWCLQPLVPASRRGTWLAQWRADLWHYALWLASNSAVPSGGVPRRILGRALGALPHALALRLDDWSLCMLSHDLKFAWRLIIRRPAFTLVAVLILGLGIGANATIFSWVERVLLQPVPGVDASQLIALHGKTTSRDDLSFSYLNFTDLRAAKPDGIEDLVAFRGVAINLRGDGEPRRVWGQLVTANFFDVLRVRPHLGRGFIASDTAAIDSAPVAVLSHDTWTRLFNADPGIVGRTITLNARPFTVVGIAPDGFRGTMVGLGLDVFVPITMQRAFMSGDRLQNRGNSFLQVYGRLAPGATVERAQAALDVIAARQATEHAANEGRGIVTEPLWRDGAAGLLLPVMATLMAVVGVVLLIACANLAGLLLARAAGRQREVAVRLAVGASRGRLVRQFLLESALLAIGGGIAGVALATWTSGLLMALMPPTPYPIAFDTGVNLRVVAFAAVTTVVTALAFGLLPALRASRPDVSSALKDAAAAAGGGAARARIRNSLVVVQVALTLLLLVCAALFVRGLTHARGVDPGFTLRNGLIAAVDLLPNGYDAAKGTAFLAQLVDRVSVIPGVEAATVATAMPLDISSGSDMGVDIEGYQAGANEEVQAYYNRVGPRYFQTMGIRIVAGRALDERDGSGRQLAVVINETMARKYWKGQDPIGRTIRYGSGPATVVGVAADGKYGRLNEEPRNYLYLSLAQNFRHDGLLIVRTNGEPDAVMPLVQAEVRRLDANLPLFDVRVVSEHMELSVFIPRLASMILGVFGGLALLLAIVGLYSVVAFGVAQRTREIGVRLALGATRADILSLVVRQGMKLALYGLVIGALLAGAAAQAIRSQLMGVTPVDPVSFGGTAALLFMVALAACVIPARRAARLDPVRALRND